MGHHHNPAFEDFSHAGRSVGNAEALAAAAPSLVDQRRRRPFQSRGGGWTAALLRGRLGGSLLAVLVAAAVFAGAARAGVITPFNGSDYYFDSQTNQGLVPFQWSYVGLPCNPDTASIRLYREPEDEIFAGGPPTGSALITYFVPGTFTVKFTYTCIRGNQVAEDQPLDEVTFSVGGVASAPRGSTLKKCSKTSDVRILAEDMNCHTAQHVADQLLKGRVTPGYNCIGTPANWQSNPRNATVICSKTSPASPAKPQVISLLPTGGNCPVLHFADNNRDYQILAVRVTCRYARGAAIRMLRAQTPIYEFVQPGHVPQWSCQVFGGVGGVCTNQLQDREIAFELMQ